MAPSTTTATIRAPATKRPSLAKRLSSRSMFKSSSKGELASPRSASKSPGGTVKRSSSFFKKRTYSNSSRSGTPRSTRSVSEDRGYDLSYDSEAATPVSAPIAQTNEVDDQSETVSELTLQDEVGASETKESEDAADKQSEVSEVEETSNIASAAVQDEDESQDYAEDSEEQATEVAAKSDEATPETEQQPNGEVAAESDEATPETQEKDGEEVTKSDDAPPEQDAVAAPEKESSTGTDVVVKEKASMSKEQRMLLFVGVGIAAALIIVTLVLLRSQYMRCKFTNCLVPETPTIQDASLITNKKGGLPKFLKKLLKR